MAVLEFLHIHKSFGAVTALRDVTVSVASGHAHAIVGENGAGKSTLLGTLAGTVRPDAGEIRRDGVRLDLARPRDALAQGIGIVHQEMLAFPNLSVAANIFAGRELTGRFGRLREREMRARAADLLARLHVPVSADALVETLPIAYRQLLQVARALAFDCRILALDEPTTSLTNAEMEHLFGILERLKAAGTTIIFVSHRLPEVFRLCDRITVLRDGSHVGTFDRDGVTADQVVQAMVGRAIPPRHVSAVRDANRPQALRVSGLTRRPAFEDVTLSVAPGEILGIFGLVGSGRTELLETIAGLAMPDSGDVVISGTARAFRSVRQAARAGVALVPEDRQRQGLFSNLSVGDNLVLPGAQAGDAVLIGRDERERASAILTRWRIKAASIDAEPASLSGGNQQKVVMAKWLATSPRVLLLDEPTKGVDVGAKFDIHEMIRERVAGGTACVLVSSDLPEVLALADRILVLREGRVQGELAVGEADEERIMRLATRPPEAA